MGRRVSERHEHDSGNVDDLTVDLEHSSGSLHLRLESVGWRTEPVKGSETLSVYDHRRGREDGTQKHSHHERASLLHDVLLTLEDSSDLFRAHNLSRNASHCKEGSGSLRAE